MKRPPEKVAKKTAIIAFYVAVQNWEFSAEKFARDVADGIHSVSKDGVISYRQVDGTMGKILKVSADAWQRKLALLVAEADRRIENEDWEWFAWLDLYAGMWLETEREDHADKFTKAITTGGKVLKTQNLRTAKAAEIKRAKGKETAKKVLAGERPVGKRQIRRIKTGR